MEALFSADMSLFGDLLVCHTSSAKLGGGLGDGWLSDGQNSLGSSRSSSPVIVPHSPEYQNYDVADVGLDWLEGNVNILDFLGTVPEDGLLDGKVGVGPTASQSPTNAVQILADLAAETAAELDAGTPPNVSLWSDTDISHQVDETSDLLNLIAENMDKDMDIVTYQAIQSALNLSPISSEDIESVLSTPSSPVHSPAPSYVSTDGFASPLSSPAPYLPVASPSSPVQYLPIASPASSVMSGGSSPASQVGYFNNDFILSPVHSSDSEMYDSDMDMLFTDAPSSNNDLITNQNSHAESDCEARRPRPYERPRKPGKPGLSKDVIQQERKMRKKQQNKDAATRYRQKKKAEANGVGDECGELEARNNELHESVDTMTKEIQYLKDLLAEVYEAKGMKLTFPKNCK